jgi:putative phage-type endonuclease
MSMVLVKTRDMERGEWLEWRRRGIGGSDAPKVVGISRRGSPYTVWLEKLGEVELEEPGEEAEWGIRQEPIIAEAFEEKTGLKVHRVNQMLQHPEHPFMIANIDRKVVGRKEGLEIKTAGEWLKDEWDGDNVPDDYYIQCQHYMAVTGYPRWWIAVLIGGNKFRYKCIERNDAVIEALIEAEKRFWWHVENRVPPEPDGSDIATEFLARQYPSSNGQTIDLPSEAERWIQQYEEASADEADAKARKEEAANRLKALLGEYERGRIGGRVVTWKSYTSTRLDTKALKAEMPDVYERYAKTTESRRFSIK